VFGLLVLVGVGVLVWKFVVPGEQFLSRFMQLLTEPRIQRGAFSVISGRSYATGSFQGRDVAIRIQLRRSEYEVGYLVIAVRSGGPATLDYAGIDARARDDAGRRALFSLAAHDLTIAVEDGWLKAQWKPHGFMIFPGRFSEDKWRPVLEAMHALARSLEAAV
jgi:hypothetical protein